MRSARPFLVAAVLLGVGAGSLSADDMDLGKTIDSVKVAVEGKHYGRALAEIQSAMAEIARLRGESLRSVFPDAPGGWTAEEAEVDGNPALTAISVGVVTHRAYTKGESRV